jgi:hypothetical protein
MILINHSKKVKQEKSESQWMKTLFIIYLGPNDVDLLRGV